MDDLYPSAHLCGNLRDFGIKDGSDELSLRGDKAALNFRDNHCGRGHSTRLIPLSIEFFRMKNRDEKEE